MSSKNPPPSMEEMVPDDVKLLCGDFIKYWPNQAAREVVQIAIANKISINVGVGLMTHFNEVWVDRYGEMLRQEMKKKPLTKQQLETLAQRQRLEAAGIFLGPGVLAGDV